MLEPLGPEHSAGMFRLWSSAEVCRHAGPASDAEGRPIALPARRSADSDRILEFFVERARAGSGVRWALVTKSHAEFVGAVGFNALAPPAELAYHLCFDAWGRGYAREACIAVLRWLRRTRGIGAVEAFVEPANEASQALARRLGFRATDDVRDGAVRYVLSPIA